MPPSATKRVYFSPFLMSSGAMTCFGQKKVSGSEIWHFRREKPGVRAHPPCFHPPLGAARVARVKAEPPTAWAPGCCAGAGLRGRPLAAAPRAGRGPALPRALGHARAFVPAASLTLARLIRPRSLSSAAHRVAILPDSEKSRVECICQTTRLF